MNAVNAGRHAIPVEKQRELDETDPTPADVAARLGAMCAYADQLNRPGRRPLSAPVLGETGRAAMFATAAGRTR